MQNPAIFPFQPALRRALTRGARVSRRPCGGVLQESLPQRLIQAHRARQLALDRGALARQLEGKLASFFDRQTGKRLLAQIQTLAHLAELGVDAG